ncbi:MAG: hypothetical protein KF683_07395 [Rubrivivax sp.]|nr:hypothetical protein [Rubrivivax sp.]
MSRTARWLAALLLAACAVLARAEGPAVAGAAEAAEAAEAALLAQSLAAMPEPALRVQSSDDGALIRGEVAALLAAPAEQVAGELRRTRPWCLVLLLHLNTKACTQSPGSAAEVAVWTGRKEHEPPERATLTRFAASLAPAGSGPALDLRLQADEGPMGTRELRLQLRVWAVPQGSLLRVDYAYRSTALSRLALRGYLATVGRGKVGFSVVGQAADGTPQLVGGVRGMVERNVVRYLLAIQSVLQTADPALPPAQRFEQAAARWFDLTERHARQLRELPRDEYLANKRLEYAESQRRQQALPAAARAPA